ncbi:phosphorylase b kinase regulatory subunit beta-like isoform X2 [Pecten maximus]|uniref:phosphorylase b kinase regulatory subunit beta-like isoform X2 n=1 Tax=Pecten maximus TaxID=6579 RepID=UPI0014591017|nr:phosphorylase b kinase regulatory subunit beta-like isoform X2 [Pecten maximus]
MSEVKASRQAKLKRLERLDSRIGYTRQMSVQSVEQDLLSKRLHEQYIILKRQILKYQGCVLGLFPAIGRDGEQAKIAHVRDSIYCAVATWALSQAYRKIDDDEGRTHELSMSAVKCMRGILFCWIRQADKVEKFKLNQSPSYALHSVFDMVTGDPVYSDEEYGHLQIDVVGLYLIYLVQMIRSGLKVIYTTDEVNFIQNLVFYVERAYRTPDYGMWERGSKYNNGSTEVHASSIGFAKAALEAINGENLYGPEGAVWSVIYVDIDAHNRNRTIFETILPRESNSKNTDASLLPTVSWPAFAIHKKPIKHRTIDKVVRKLKGNHGIKRFLRDGYRTVMEDKTRKHYRPAEIKLFDGIECEWPLFYVYLLIDNIFRNDKEGIEHYTNLINPLLRKSNDGDLLPMFYFVPKEQLDLERNMRPGTAEWYPSAEGSTDGVFLWGQSIYFISQLLMDGLLNVMELDPIRRHLPASERPVNSSRYSSFQVTPPDLVVQVALIAESSRLQQVLATYGIQTQTPNQIDPIQIWSPKELTKAYEYLGINTKLGLSGRPKRPFGVLSTSKIYRIGGQTVLCYPLLFEVSDFYLAQDMSIVLDDLKNDLAFLSQCWKLYGRPTFCMILRENNIRGQNFGEFLDLLAQFKRGQVDNIRIRLGKLQSLISAATVEHLDFLSNLPDPLKFCAFEGKTISSSFRSLTDIPKLPQLNDTDLNMSDTDLSHKATWDLVQMLNHYEGMTAQCRLMKVLYQREGPQFHIDNELISSRMEKLINQASLYKKWSVVRMMAALLGKIVDSLAPSITTILVRGKQITVGVYGHEEEVLDKPISPNELKNILYSVCLPHDIQQAVIQQELILCIGKLIATKPEIFEGILKIRIGWFVRAMQIELESDPTDLYSLSPSNIKLKLYSLLTCNVDEAHLRTPLQRRQLDGALNKVPKDFYDRVWQILENTPGGIKVAGYHLPQHPTLSDMTMYELNFSLLVEQMLSKIVDPSYRQIMVETFIVVSTMLNRNPEVTFEQSVNMDKIIHDAFEEYQRDKSKHEGQEKMDEMRNFFNTPANIRHGTTSYITKAVIRNLLEGEVKFVGDDFCCIT